MTLDFFIELRSVRTYSCSVVFFTAPEKGKPDNKKRFPADWHHAFEYLCKIINE